MRVNEGITFYRPFNLDREKISRICKCEGIDEESSYYRDIREGDRKRRALILGIGGIP